MNQTEMLHQMCHEVLAVADVRAICKNRGLPNQAASSRPMLETLFLSDAGVAVAICHNRQFAGVRLDEHPLLPVADAVRAVAAEHLR